MTKKTLAGAIIKSENEDDSSFFIQKLLEWLGPIDYVTIDFSKRLEAGVKRFFTIEQILKCAFHAPQLLNRGLLKELTRLKNEKYQDEIRELLRLRHYSLEVEAETRKGKSTTFKFKESKLAWENYLKLRSICISSTPRNIERRLTTFFKSVSFAQWKGASLLKEKFELLLPKRGLTDKSLPPFKTKVYRAWRATLLSFRNELEQSKSGFKDAKYLVLTNPLNTDRFEKQELRKALAKFPWLRPIRRIVTKFYRQFHVAPAKRCSLNFLRALVSEGSHAWLKSAIETLIECEAQVFRFQELVEQNPRLKDAKSIKVVDESTMRKINKLYQAQFGMRTVENLEMRLTHYLKCPFIVVPSVLEELKN